jgi:hypothetical protein
LDAELGRVAVERLVGAAKAKDLVLEEAYAPGSRVGRCLCSVVFPREVFIILSEKCMRRSTSGTWNDLLRTAWWMKSFSGKVGW